MNIKEAYIDIFVIYMYLLTYIEKYISFLIALFPSLDLYFRCICVAPFW